MSIIRARGQYSGRVYGWRIAGDTPTVDEQMAFDEYVRRREREFAQEYQQRWGRNIEPQGTFVGEGIRSLLAGPADLAERGLLGLATILPENLEEPTREQIRRLGYWAQQRLAPYPNYEGSLTRTIGEAIGSTLPFFGLTRLGAPGILAGVGLGAAAGAGEQSERARAANASEEERNNAARLGALIGVTEILAPAALHGFFSSLLRAGVPATTIRARLGRIASAATFEGAQEAAAEFLHNAVEQGVYNPERDLIDGVLPAGGIGASAGAIIQSLAEFAIRNRGALSRVNNTTSEVTPTAPPATPDEEQLQLPLPEPIEPLRPRMPEGAEQGDFFGSRSATQYDTSTTTTTAPPAAAPPAYDTSTTTTTAPPAAINVPQEPDFDVETTLNTLRINDGDYIKTIKDLGISYPDLVRRIDYLKSIGRINYDPASRRMQFIDTVSEPTVVKNTKRTKRDTNENVKQLLDILNSLEIPPAAPIRRRVSSGQITNEDDLRKQLTNYIKNPRVSPDVRNRVQTWLNLPVNEQLSQVEIQNEQGNEIDKKQPTASPFVGPTSAGLDTPADRTGAQDSGTKSVAGMQPGRDQSAGASAPVTPAVAEPVSGAPEPDVSEATQPPALDTETPQPDTQPPALDTETPQPDAQPSARGRRGTKRAATQPSEPDTGAEDIYGEPLAGGVGRGVRRGVRRGAGQVAGQDAGQVAGQDTGQVAEQPTTQETKVIRRPTSKFVPFVLKANEKPKPPLKQESVVAKQMFARWFDANVDNNIKSLNNNLRPRDIETIDIYVSDAEAILKLINEGPPNPSDDKNNTPKAAAYRYFTRYRDPGLTLVSIAHDAAEQAAYQQHILQRRADGKKHAVQGMFGPPSYTKEKLREERDKKLYPADNLLIGLGRVPGSRAMEWVEANLSKFVVSELKSMMESPASKEKPGFKFVNILDDIKLRDEIQKIRKQTIEDATENSTDAKVSPKDGARFSYIWPRSTHPQVSALIHSGDFSGALSALSITASNAYQRKLAAALLPRLKNIRVQTIPSAVLARIQGALSPETPTLGKRPAAVYIWPASNAEINQLRNNGHYEAANLIERYNGQILFDSEVPISPELVLHEAVHAAADSVLNNPMHPLTRRLENLRRALLERMPADTYGLNNVHELLAEGMSNPAFRRDLSYLNTSGERRSALERFLSIIRDFIRSLLNLPPSGPQNPRSARDLIDQTMDNILSLGPSDVGTGSVVGASFKMIEGARDVLDSIKNNTRVPTAADIQSMKKMLQNISVPREWKQVFTHLFMPLRYVADAASKYMPSATELADAVNQHKAEIDKYHQIIVSSVSKVTDILSKYRDNQNIIDDFNRAIHQGTLIATLFGVDFRKLRSVYENEPYKFDSDALEAYDRVRLAYDSLPPDVQEAVNRVFAMPTALRPELQSAIYERISSLAPVSKAMQEKIFKIIYDKVFAKDLIDPFAPLRRKGEYWISYTGIDPETGRPDFFVHAFQTRAEQQEAIRRLMALESGVDKNSITPFMNPATKPVKPEVPMEYVAKVLDAVEEFSEITNLPDPETGQPGGLRQRIIELMLDNLPETSFVHSFRKRKGVRGFIGDMTPFTENLTYGDIVKNITEANQNLAKQIADLKFGARFASLRTRIENEYTDFINMQPLQDADFAETINRINTDPTLTQEQKIIAAQEARTNYLNKRSREIEEAKNFYETLRSYSFVPFRHRAKWASIAVSGTYMLTLGFNVSTALITFAQIPMFISPYLGGKYGMKRTISAIGVAHRLLAASGTERDRYVINEKGQIVTERAASPIYLFSIDNYTGTDPKSAHLEPLLRIARRNGVFHHSLIQNELLGENPTLWQRIAGWSGILQHHAERISREIALVSAYYLELQTQMGNNMPMNKFIDGLKDGSIKPSQEQMEAAALEAVDISERTNGPILAAAGPLASQNDIGAVVYLFKRHPIAMLNLLLQTAKRANFFNLSPEARTQDQNIALRQFAGMMGVMALMSGALGLPFMQLISAFYDLLIADDDEPDFDTVVRMTLGEAGSYGLIDFLTNMRVSERIGLNNAIYRPGFSYEELPPQYRLIEGIGGPVVGMINKYFNRFPELWAQEQYWRAVETIMPTTFANLMRAYRFSQEGILTMRGDPIVNDIGPYDIVTQAFGFMPAHYAQQLSINSQRSRIDNAINTRRTRLLQQLYIAMRNHDWDTVEEIYRRIDEFNSRNPNNPITGETIRNSLRQHVRTTGQLISGVNITPRNRQRIDEMIELGSPTVWGM